MGRSPCCDKVGLKKGPWTPDEDKKLLQYIEENGIGSWRLLPSKAGLKRCGKSCRLRWTNYLRPDIKRGKFSLQEEQTIIQLHALLGNRWAAIASHLPMRTDNEIKNYWNTHLTKKLTKMGIDPTTHKPMSHDWVQSRDIANISHMAQWESARLEAEARLVQETKLMKNPNLNRPPPRLPPPTPTPPVSPPRPPCLDILKVWAWTNPGIDISTMILNGSSSIADMNYVEGLIPCKVEKYCSNISDREDEAKGMMKNATFELQEPLDFTHVYDPLKFSDFMCFTDFPLSMADF